MSIVVLDASDGHPIANARVLLVGGQPLSELTNKDGVAVLYDVTPDTYAVVVSAPGYKSFNERGVDISGAVAQVSLNIRMAGASKLQTIASMQVSTTKYGSLSDPFQQFDSTLKSMLPGTSLGSALNIISNGSINGHDPTASSFLIDGVPINAPRYAAQLNGFDSDLVTGANISGIPLEGFAGGTASLDMIYPTLSWMQSTSDEFDSYSGASYTATISGTSGFTGIAIQHSARWSGGPLNDVAYLDGSGLDYSHSQTSSIAGTAAVVQGAVGATSLRIRSVDSRSAADILCLTITTDVPCGYGPGNHTSANFSFQDLRASSILAGNDIAFDIAFTNSTQSSDMTHRVIDGFAAPFVQDSSNKDVEGRLSLDHSAGLHDSLSATASYSFATNVFDSWSDNNRLSSASGERFLSFDFAERHDFHNGKSLTTSVSGSGAGNFAQSSVREVYNQRIGGSDTLSLAASAFRSDSNAAPLRSVPDPYSLQFDCASATAYGSGPGFDPSGRQDSVGLNAAYAHHLRAGGVSLELYSQRQYGLMVMTPVSATAFNSSLLPPMFFPIAESLFASPGQCGGKQLLPANIFLNTLVSGVHGVYDGARLNLFEVINPHVIAAADYRYTAARDISRNSLLNYSTSTIISGRQLPNTPLHKAHVTLGYVNNTGFSGVIDAEYTSKNNSNNLPSYVVMNAGVSSHLGGAVLTATVRNLLNAYPGNFISSANAIPLPTNNGSYLATLATPLGPRRFQVVAAFGLGAGARSSSPTMPGNLLDRLLAMGIPGVVSLNNRYMRKLEIDSARTSCDASMRERLEPLLEGLSYDYTTAHNDLSAPRVVVQRDSGGSGTLFLMPLDPYVETDLEVCSAIHLGNVEQARRMGLPIPPPSISGGYSIGYNEHVGFYEIWGSISMSPSEGRFRYYPFGSPTLDDPFSVENRCPSELKGAAITLLRDLRSAIADRRSTETWSILAMRSSDAVGVRPTAGNSLAIMFDCAHVTGIPKTQLEKMHLPGEPLPNLNFSAKVGLYVVE